MMRLLAVLFMCLAFVSPVLAGEAEEAFARGVAAYNEGDYPAAFAAFRSAAERGMGDAQFNLGLMYANGQGTAQDHGEALYWWRKAAAQGVADAQNNLGMMYENGLGVPPDYGEAVRWYREAAEQGRPFAQHNLGAMYANGRGVERDLVQAYMWFHLATAGHPAGPVRNQSAEARDRVAQLMTAPELGEARRLAREWLPAAQRASAAAAARGKTAASGGKPPAKPSKNYVKLAQQALRELGYDPGPLDGIEGERTRAALAAFQEDTGLEATGELTMELVHRLTRYVRGGDAASGRE
ncbi:MAG: peptidoglycan-binding protein [Alphaproteobacteria bacterium]